MSINIENLKGKLLEEKDILEKELGQLGIKDPKTGDWGAVLSEDHDNHADANDRGDRDEEFGLAAEKVGELEIRLRQVEIALGKIESGDGTFGICEISKEVIEADRMEANPAARTCKVHINENPDKQ